MGIFNLNAEKAVEADSIRTNNSNLKPVGAYKVTVDEVRFYSEDGKTPHFSFQLDIVGMLEKDGSTFATKENGSKVYTGAKLFMKAFVSEKALFGLIEFQDIMEFDSDVETLVEELNSFNSEAEAIAWVKSWINTETQFNVYVTHNAIPDTDPVKYSERVQISRKQ